MKAWLAVSATVLLCLTADPGSAQQAAAPDAATPTEPKCVASPPPDDLIGSPHWIAAPTADALSRFYPRRERRVGAPGCAILQCRVGPEGGLGECVILDERPPDGGYGQAALKLSRFFRMQLEDRDGKPVAGRLVRLPIIFRFAGA